MTYIIKLMYERDRVHGGGGGGGVGVGGGGGGWKGG